jgi:hypothetical protein
MAAANVSGGIALLLSQHLKSNEIREALAQTSHGDSVNICAAMTRSTVGECRPASSLADSIQPVR